MKTEEYLNTLFLEAGWHKGRNIILEGILDVDCDAHSAAVQVLKEFGSLSVGQTGSGRECAASDIGFYPRPRYEAEGICQEWEAKVGKLVAIASAHNQHMLILINSEGFLYIFTSADEQLYFGGSFQETVAKLLLGLSYGPVIEKA